MRASDGPGTTGDIFARHRMKHAIGATKRRASLLLRLILLVALACVVTLEARSLISEAHAGASKPACPAPDFRSFVAAFAESAAIQRQYTRIPFVYGLLDSGLITSGREKDAFSTKLIYSFEEIPFFDRSDGGRIFPSKKKRKKGGLVYNFKSPPDSEYFGKDTVAHLGLVEGDLWLAYVFVRADDCWTLIEIDDLST